jgi:hypothetical protein
LAPPLRSPSVARLHHGLLRLTATALPSSFFEPRLAPGSKTEKGKLLYLEGGGRALEEGKGAGGGPLPDGGDGPEEGGGRVGGAARWHSSPRGGPDPPPPCIGGLAPPPLVELISIVGPPPPPCAGGPAPLLHRSSSSLLVLLLRASTSGLLLPCHASHHQSSTIDEGMRENTVGSAFSSPVPVDARPHEELQCPHQCAVSACGRRCDVCWR